MTPERAAFGFRSFVVMCQGVSIAFTWQLWQSRMMPPLLPAVPLPVFDMGSLLLISLVLVLIRPRAGLIVHSVLLVYAMLTDQTRIQPEFISLTILMWGTLPGAAAKTLTRTHLIALWTWAGINKLLSPVFLQSTGPYMMRIGFGFLPDWILANAGVLIALTEIFIGITFLIPRTRRLAVLIAIGLHAGILFTLTVGMNYNSAVWGWNAALVVAGFYYGWTWRDSLLTAVRTVKPLAATLMVFMLVSPIGFYVGIFDAYLSHNLYSSNVALADAPISPGIVMDMLNVPIPPEHRVYTQFFRLTCAHGDTMIIHDTRPYFIAQGKGETTLECEQ